MEIVIARLLDNPIFRIDNPINENNINRLNSVADYVVHPSQSAFMQARYIIDGLSPCMKQFMRCITKS
jgi:hypothetical protein